MTKLPLSDQLTQRITLYKRIRGETPEGDPTQTWSPVVRVWARVRMKIVPELAVPSPGGEGQRVEITMRCTGYRFQAIEWRGRLYRIQGRGLENPDTMTWQGVGKEVL